MPKISQLTTRSGAQLTGSEYVPLQVGTGNARSTITEMTNFISTIIDAGASVTVSQNAPAGAELGDLWFDDSTGALYVWITDGGGAWVQTNGGGGQSGGGGGASVTTGTTAPTSPANGDLWFDETVAELYVYLASESAWVQTNGGGGGGGGGYFSTGWVNTDGTTQLAARASLTFQHNLNTTDITTSIWLADDSNGTNAFEVKDYYASSKGSNAPWTVGAGITNITSTEFTVTIAEDSVGNINSTGDAIGVDVVGKYIKVVAISSGGSGGGGGGGPRAYVAFDGTAADLTASITNSLNVASITDNSTGLYTVTFFTPITNPVPTVSVYESTISNPFDGSFKSVSDTSIQIITGTNSTGKIDVDKVFLVVH